MTQYIKQETVFYQQMKHWEESWKYDALRNIFDKLKRLFHLVMKHCVECSILLFKQNDFRKRNEGCKNEQFFIWFPNTHISFVFSLWIINEFGKFILKNHSSTKSSLTPFFLFKIKVRDTFPSRCSVEQNKFAVLPYNL